MSPEEISLHKRLYQVSRMCGRYAADIPMKMADPARGEDLAEVLEATARMLRGRAGQAPARVARPVSSGFFALLRRLRPTTSRSG